VDVLETRLTREYGIRYPFVGAGMGGVSLAPLAAAVSAAGGLGMIGAVAEPPDRVEAMIAEVRGRTSAPFGVDLVVGESAMGPLTTPEHVELCRAEGVPVVVFHMDTPRDDWVRGLQRAGTRVWKQVASLDETRAAVAAGVDGLVVQGAQAGGHNRSTTPLERLLPAVAAEAGGRLLLAAGGIADGHSAARALSIGADGVWVGTRLLASRESNAHPEYQRRVLAATGEQDTVVTTLFGPEQPGEPVRCLRNRAVERGGGGPDVIGHTVVGGRPYAMPAYSLMPPTRDTEGDLDEMCLYAGGQSAAVIADVPTAAEIIEAMMSGARALLETGFALSGQHSASRASATAR
jgi:enoyl-[acyl-carrier protein] reductase II